MSAIPQLIELKNIPVGFKYYIPFSSENFRIEPEIKDQYGRPEGYRLWINLNAKASIRKYSIYNVAVVKKKDKIVFRYEFVEEFYDALLKYLLNYWENEKLHLSVSEVRNELAKKNPEKEFSPFYSKGFNNYVERVAQSLQQSLQKGGQNIGEEQMIFFQSLIRLAQLKLMNLKEEELLSMQDFSQIFFDLKKPSSVDYSKILNFLSGVGLSEEQEDKIFTYLELNRLLDGEPFQKEGKHGVLLYGPPGTGKTTTMKAFFGVFEVLGCQVFEVNANNLISRAQVGAFAAEISKQIFEPAIEKIIKYRKPCLVYVDEATSLVSKPKESSVSEWYQEGLDTIKNYLNRSKFPGIILCLATNASLSDLDKTIVGDDGRLEAVYFDFLNKDQFKVLWKDKLKKNLSLDEDVLKLWGEGGGIDKLSEICSNVVSGRFVANFCSTYREQYLSSKENKGIKGIFIRKDQRRNLTREASGEVINFEDFYVNFLNKLEKRLKIEIDAGVEEIKKDHYFTTQERDAKIEEIKEKYKLKLDEIKLKLEGGGVSKKIDLSSLKTIDEFKEEFEKNLQLLKGINQRLLFYETNRIDEKELKSMFEGLFQLIIYFSREPNLTDYVKFNDLKGVDVASYRRNFNFIVEHRMQLWTENEHVISHADYVFLMQLIGQFVKLFEK